MTFVNSPIFRVGLALAFSISAFAARGVENKTPSEQNPSVKTAKPKKAEEKPDPVEAEYERLLEFDDAAETECDRWIKEFNAFEAQAPGAGGSKAALSLKVEQRLETVRKAYEDFLQRNPKHVEGRIAYGSFLNDIQEESSAVTQWEKALELDPKNPAPWNNLANYYGHFGPVKKAFDYYEKAIQLNPRETVYIQNLATTTYLFRKDAIEKYGITETQVFDKALDLYRQAIKLDPGNFLLATDLAESYYGIRPLRTQEALEAWNYALKIAENDLSRQGVYLHLARVELNSGMFPEARQHLDLVNLEALQPLKTRLGRNLAERKEIAAKGIQPDPILLEEEKVRKVLPEAKPATLKKK